MAVTTGNDYDHIAIQNGSNTVLHYQKDNKFRNWSVGSDTVDFLTVKSCTPNSNKYFKLYIDDEGALIVRKGDNWFDVDYYDGDELLHTEEIWTSGTNATWNETPTKEQTATASYTFLGWDTSSSAETVNPNAQTNITSDRSLYAVWKVERPKLTVKFHSDPNTVLETVEGVEYGTSLYDVMSGKSWVANVIGIFDITDWLIDSSSQSPDIYVGDNSTSIMDSEAGVTALRNTQITRNSNYGLMLKSTDGG